MTCAPKNMYNNVTLTDPTIKGDVVLDPSAAASFIRELNPELQKAMDATVEVSIEDHTNRGWNFKDVNFLGRVLMNEQAAKDFVKGMEAPLVAALTGMLRGASLEGVTVDSASAVNIATALGEKGPAAVLAAGLAEAMAAQLGTAMRGKSLSDLILNTPSIKGGEATGLALKDSSADHFDTETLHVDKELMLSNEAAEKLVKIVEGVQGHGVLTNREGVKINGELLLTKADYDSIMAHIECETTLYGCDGQVLTKGDQIALCSDLRKLGEEFAQMIVDMDIPKQIAEEMDRRGLATIDYVDGAITILTLRIEEISSQQSDLDHKVNLLQNQVDEFPVWDLKDGKGDPLAKDASVYTKEQADAEHAKLEESVDAVMGRVDELEPKVADNTEAISELDKALVANNLRDDEQDALIKANKEAVDADSKLLHDENDEQDRRMDEMDKSVADAVVTAKDAKDTADGAKKSADEATEAVEELKGALEGKQDKLTDSVTTTVVPAPQGRSAGGKGGSQSIELKVSAEEDNALTVKEDGVYVAPTVGGPPIVDAGGVEQDADTPVYSKEAVDEKLAEANGSIAGKQDKLGDSATVAVVDTDGTPTANVVVSAKEGNMLVAEADGVFVPEYTGGPTVVDSEGNILPDGTVVLARVAVDELIDGVTKELEGKQDLLGNSPTVKITTTEGKSTADVVLSEEIGNAVVIKPEGIFVEDHSAVIQELLDRMAAVEECSGCIPKRAEIVYRNKDGEVKYSPITDDAIHLTQAVEVISWGESEPKPNARIVTRSGSMTGLTAIKVPDHEPSWLRNYASLLEGWSTIEGDLSGWDVSEATSAEGMFARTKDIVGDISGWRMPNATSTRRMFDGNSVFNQDVSGLLQSSVVEDVSEMFRGCKVFNLALPLWDMRRVDNASGMFEGCTKLEHPQDSWSMPNLSESKYMFSDCVSLQIVKPQWRGAPESMEGMYLDCTALTSADLTRIDASNNRSTTSLFSGCKKLKDVALDGWSTPNLETTKGMFAMCTSLENLSGVGAGGGFDMTKVVVASRMFYLCNKLKSLDVSAWGMTSLTDGAEMFSHCRAPNLDVSDWSTARLVSGNGMFENSGARGGLGGNQALLNPNVSAWDTGLLADASSMFAGLVEFTGAALAKWNTRSLKKANGMLDGCSSVVRGVSTWNVSKLENAQDMFKMCASLVDDFSNWDTSSVTTMHGMFNGCGKLPSTFNKWDVSSVRTMSEMFHHCGALGATADFSKWCVTNVTTAPKDFATGANMPPAKLPVWGTCPQ